MPQNECLVNYSTEICFFMFQDSSITLDMGCCVKIQNNSALVEEPLDHLIFAVHNLLTLQPHEEEGHNTFSETCFDFSLSQDQEVYTP